MVILKIIRHCWQATLSGGHVLDRIAFASKIAVLCICVGIMFGGRYPPAHAQANTGFATVPVITVEDAKQDIHLEEANEHMRSTDAALAEVKAQSNANSLAISGLQGEERGWGAGLGALMAVQIIIQLTKYKAAALAKVITQ